MDEKTRQQRHLGTWRAERQRAATPMPNVARTITRSLSFFTASTGFSSRFFFFFLKQRSWLLASQLTSPSSQTAPKPNPEGGSPGERVCGGDRNGARSTGEGRRRMGATGRAAESAEASGTWLYWAGRRRGRGHRDGERLANVLRRKTEESVFFYPRSGRLNQVKLAEAASEELKSGKLDLRQEIFCCATGSCLSTDTSVSVNVQAFP